VVGESEDFFGPGRVTGAGVLNRGAVSRRRQMRVLVRARGKYVLNWEKCQAYARTAPGQGQA